MSLSQFFIFNVQTLYSLGLEQVASNKVVRFGINGYAFHAAPAYISAVASVEVFTNETLLGLWAKDIFNNSPLWLRDQDQIERLELTQKLEIIPQLLFGQTFNKGIQPFQDMNRLVKVRNDVTHYKGKLQKDWDDVPDYIKYLEKHNIALPKPPDGGNSDWLSKICTTEGMRWANNTVCRVIHTLVSFAPASKQAILFNGLPSNFVEIPDSMPIEYFRERGIEIK